MATLVNEQIPVNGDVTLHYQTIGPSRLSYANDKDIECQRSHTLRKIGMQDRLRRKLIKKHALRNGDATDVHVGPLARS